MIDEPQAILDFLDRDKRPGQGLFILHLRPADDPHEHLVDRFAARHLTFRGKMLLNN
jgi:hypothetical protein